MFYHVTSLVSKTVFYELLNYEPYRMLMPLGVGNFENTETKHQLQMRLQMCPYLKVGKECSLKGCNEFRYVGMIYPPHDQCPKMVFSSIQNWPKSKILEFFWLALKNRFGFRRVSHRALVSRCINLS